MNQSLQCGYSSQSPVRFALINKSSQALLVQVLILPEFLIYSLMCAAKDGLKSVFSTSEPLLLSNSSEPDHTPT